MPNKNLPETLTWKAPTYQEQERSSGWYLGFTLISVALLAFAIYNKSIITGITFILIILVVFILSIQSSTITTYRIGKTGISVGNTPYPYKTIKKFWIIYDPPEIKTINFETTAYINNKVSLQLGSQDPVQVKLVLSQYLREDLDREESLSETLARRLKI